MEKEIMEEYDITYDDMEDYQNNIDLEFDELLTNICNMTDVEFVEYFKQFNNEDMTE